MIKSVEEEVVDVRGLSRVENFWQQVVWGAQPPGSYSHFRIHNVSKFTRAVSMI